MSITCTFVEYHDDMYPEFAPEQIVVTCTDTATLWVYGTDETGFEIDSAVCRRHADLLAEYTSGSTPISDDFVHGWEGGCEQAAKLPLDDRKIAIILHEGVAAAVPLPDGTGDILTGYRAGMELTLSQRAGDAWSASMADD